MKRTELTITQTTEEYDQSMLDSAITMAQSKVLQLGLADYTNASLSLELGPTKIDITLKDEPESSIE